MKRGLACLATVGLLAGAASAQTCTENVLDGFNVEFGYGSGGNGLSIGQTFTACGDGLVTTITIHEGDGSTGGPYDLWLAPEIGGGNDAYTVAPPTETIADPGGVFPRFTTLRLQNPFPVTAGSVYRFIVDHAGTIDIRCTNDAAPADYVGGEATDSFGTYDTFDLDFELTIVDNPDASCAAELVTDPTLADSGGTLGIGPFVDATGEPFNVAIDCTGASSPSLYVIEIRPAKAALPLASKWGLLHLAGPKLLGTTGSHTVSVEEFAPAPGLVLPLDTALIGTSFAVQGFCGGFSPVGRTTNALVQTIGG